MSTSSPRRDRYTARFVVTEAFRQQVQARLAAEWGRSPKEAPYTVCLAYPSPYRVGMSSLGLQAIYGAIHALPGVACERAFLQDDAEESGNVQKPVSYESLRELGDFPVVAFSVAYELELAGLVRMLQSAGLGALREHRSERAPLILAGGPLTFSNPAPLGPFVDAVIMGEGEQVIGPVLDQAHQSSSKDAALSAIARIPGVWVPALHGEVLPSLATADDSLLPARSRIVTPNTELSGMFLVEAERGCSRGCGYCVMRRTTNGGMRIVPKERVLDAIPPEMRRVGLVGAAVSDHPQIVEIVRSLAESGREVGLSSLRPDRLNEPFVEALRFGGYRTLTTALDGASQRLRDGIDRRGRVEHYERAASLARRHRMTRLKLYLMIGLPGETDEDIDECVRLVVELSRIVPVAVGISPFCAKRRTPLDGMPFAGVARVQSRIKRLRRGVRGRVDIRATSARWAWIEHVLAQGGGAEGRAVYDAVLAGGTFQDYERSLAGLGHSPSGAGYEAVSLPRSSI